MSAPISQDYFASDNADIPSHDIDASLDGKKEEAVLVKQLSFRDYDIFSKNEKSFEITGMTNTKLGNGFVMCDHRNGSIKLLDETFNVTSRLTSVFEPWGITAITPTYLVVSFPFVRLLQFIKVKDESRLFYWYPVKSGNEYYGLAHDEGFIAAVCKYDGTVNTPSIHVLDQTGNVHHVIYQSSDGSKLFKNPQFIAVSDTTHVFYVTDVDLKRVISLNKDGIIFNTFSMPGCDPTGLCVDHINNTVYVCDKGGDYVYHLDHGLVPIECLTSRYEKTTDALSILFLGKDNIIVVSMSGKPYIRALQM